MWSLSNPCKALAFYSRLAICFALENTIWWWFDEILTSFLTIWKDEYEITSIFLHFLPQKLQKLSRIWRLFRLSRLLAVESFKSNTSNWPRPLMIDLYYVLLVFYNLTLMHFVRFSPPFFWVNWSVFLQAKSGFWQIRRRFFVLAKLSNPSE